MESLDQSLKKALTQKSALPNIDKVRTKIHRERRTKSSTSNHHSLFIDKVKDVDKITRYDNLEIVEISKEQRKLKGLLKEFNHETFNILSKFIERSVEKKPKKQRGASISVMEIRKKEIENNENILEICRKEMEGLESRCSFLKYLSLEEVENKINKVKEEIEEIKGENRNMTKGNALRGKDIHQKNGDEKPSILYEIEQQILFQEKKKRKLLESTDTVKQELLSLQKNISGIGAGMEIQESELISKEKQDQEINNQQKLLSIYENKKNEFQMKNKSVEKIEMKNDKNFVGSELRKNSLSSRKKSYLLKDRYQPTYLKLLKELESAIKKISGIENEIESMNDKISKSKEETEILEKKIIFVQKQLQSEKEDVEEVLQQYPSWATNIDEVEIKGETE